MSQVPSVPPSIALVISLVLATIVSFKSAGRELAGHR